MFRLSFDKNELFSMSYNSKSKPLSLAKIKIFLATSIPLRSIFGSGSVYHSVEACFTTEEKVVDASNLLNTKFRLPESTAWILWTLSPEAIKFLSVSIIGKPAPTLV